MDSALVFAQDSAAPVAATPALPAPPTAEEIEGLDIGEHGNEAYHGFVMVRTE